MEWETVEQTKGGAIIVAEGEHYRIFKVKTNSTRLADQLYLRVEWTNMEKCVDMNKTVTLALQELIDQTEKVFDGQPGDTLQMQIAHPTWYKPIYIPPSARQRFTLSHILYRIKNRITDLDQNWDVKITRNSEI